MRCVARVTFLVYYINGRRNRVGDYLCQITQEEDDVDVEF